MEVAGPDYFRTFDVPIRRGRGFTPADRQDSPQVIVVSTAVAHQFWPAEEPLGKRLQMLGGPGVGPLPGWWTVVGVVGETRYRDLRNQVPTVYFPYQQYVAFGNFAVRTSGEVSAVYAQIRREVEASGAGVSLMKMHSMDGLLDEPLAQPRMSAILLGAFAGAALLLAAIGLYGTLAFAVRQRTRELGIRIALGATVRQVRRLVLKEALGVVGLGTVVGLCVAVASLQVLKAMVFEISPTDPITLASVCGLLAVVAAIAAYLPARRATRIDPVQALRSD